MEDIEKYRSTWRDSVYETCARLSASLSLSTLAVFGTEALRACLARVGGEPQLHDVVRVGQERSRWGEGHRAFDAVRKLTAVRDRERPAGSEVAYAMLFVGENTARVIYNATSPPDPFDDDAGAYLLVSQTEVIRDANAPDLEDTIWNMLRDAIRSQ